MDILKITLIEDDESEILTFKRTCEVISRKEGINIDLIICKSIAEFKEKILDIIASDGLVVDMKLNNSSGDEESGVSVIDYFSNQKIIIPTVVFTGTQDPIISTHPFIDIKIKGDAEISELIKNFQNIKKSGILDILGGKGLLQNHLYNVFHNNINKQKDKWIRHSVDNLDSTKKALLRHTLNHLYQYLDQDDEMVFLEEMYIYPPITKNITPGCIIKKDQIYYLILTPACDLVPRKKKIKDNEGNYIQDDEGNIKVEMKPKTNCVLLAEIQPLAITLDEVLEIENLSRNKKNIQKCLDKIFKDNLDYYHFLPEAFDFEGGIVLFRSINTIEPEKLIEEYSASVINISPLFLKNIQSRFARYYTRQGQPDINYTKYLEDKIAQFLI